MKEKIKVCLISTIFLLLILIRIYFYFSQIELKTQDIYIAVINTISLLVVVLSILYDIWICLQKIQKEVSKELGRSTYDNDIKKFTQIAIRVCLILALISIIYPLFFRSALVNDIITIVALGISLINKELTYIICEIML